MIFPKRKPLYERLILTNGFFLLIGILIGAYDTPYRYIDLKTSWLIVVAIITIVFNTFVIVDYMTRNSGAILQFGSVLFFCGLVLLVMGNFSTLLALYVEWVVASPMISIGLTGVVIGAFLYFYLLLDFIYGEYKRRKGRKGGAK
jgi:FlaA1/EpsC-like NDP-sugar epimerase